MGSTSVHGTQVGVLTDPDKFPRPAISTTARLTIFQRIVADGERMHVGVTGEIDLTTVSVLAGALEPARFAP